MKRNLIVVSMACAITLMFCDAAFAGASNSAAAGGGAGGFGAFSAYGCYSANATQVVGCFKTKQKADASSKVGASGFGSFGVYGYTEAENKKKGFCGSCTKNSAEAWTDQGIEKGIGSMSGSSGSEAKQCTSPRGSAQHVEANAKTNMAACAKEWGQSAGIYGENAARQRCDKAENGFEGYGEQFGSGGVIARQELKGNATQLTGGKHSPTVQKAGASGSQFMAVTGFGAQNMAISVENKTK